MSPLEIGVLIGLVTVLVLGSGIPVAFGLTAVALFFLAIFEGPDSLIFTGELFFSGLSNFTLVSIPMFIAMGAAVASSPAGSDLYGALDRWLTRVPGGLAISNIGACSIFAALSGSSPATCAAIGKMGIPEMRKHGYPEELATGSIADPIDMTQLCSTAALVVAESIRRAVMQAKGLGEIPSSGEI